MKNPNIFSRFQLSTFMKSRHIRIHTGEKPFKCSHPNCTYAFRASGDLHKHMRRHNSTTTNIRQHVCQLCDRAFERNYDLKSEYRIKFDSKVATVTIDTFVIFQILGHELTHKKNEEGVGYTCEFCSKRFVRKVNSKRMPFHVNKMSSLNCYCVCLTGSA